MRGISRKVGSILSFRKKDEETPVRRGPPPSKPSKPDFMRSGSAPMPQVDSSGMADWSVPQTISEYRHYSFDNAAHQSVATTRGYAEPTMTVQPRKYYTSSAESTAYGEDSELELGPGCYLDYDPRSGGVLYALWSMDQVDSPRAYFSPTKHVPKFKFQHNHGRYELIRGIGVDKKKYFAGWLQFLRMARDYNGSFVMLDYNNRNVDIWCFSEEGIVYKLECYNAYSLSRVEAAVVMPRRNAIYEGLGQVSKGYFLSLSRNEGEAIDFHR